MAIGGATRRDFLKAVGSGAGSLFLRRRLREAPRSSGGRPPLILFISDDHGWADAGCYGHGVVRTPHLDRLASEGMRFTHAFAGSPSCTPSRSVLYTGLMPWRNGAHPNHSAIRPGLRTWPRYFADLGYRAVLAGKTHIRPREAFPFEYVPARLRGPRALPVPRRYGQDLDVEAIDRLLAGHASRRGARPLCLIIACWSPHVVWRFKRYDPDEVPLPPYLVDTPLTREAMARYLSDVTLMDERLGACLASIRRHGLGERALLAYTSDQGAQWPHAKWNLYDAGLRVPLIVRWPGRVRPGTTSDALVGLADLLPTFFEAAGGVPPRDLDGRSFLPVLAERSREHREEIFAAHTGDGRMNDFPMRAIRTRTHKYILNLRPERLYTTHITNGADRDGRDYWESWIEKAKTDRGAARIVRAYQHRPPEELYDLRADPHEVRTIATGPGERDRVARLRRRLEAWMKEQGDPGA